MESGQQQVNFRPRQAAQYLNVGLSTIWLYIKQGKINATKLSERVTIIPRVELERFVAEAVDCAA